ncbi:MAG: ABC transporter permease subunit [Streptosporangiales bacterium]|nr:ABC transporter permease subunit [Streptosporangiales bacterium]
MPGEVTAQATANRSDNNGGNGKNGNGDAPTVRTPEAERGLMAWYRRRSVLVHTVLTVLLGLGIWQIAAANTSALVMVPLGDIAGALVDTIKSGQLWRDFFASFQGFTVGLLIASAAGIVIGVFMATSKIVFDFLDPWISALYSTPLIALAPLFIVVFGIGLSAKVAVVITLAIFPVIINTASGIRTTDYNLIECAYSFGASRRQIFTQVLIPSAVPFIVTGLRLAVGRGLIAVVVAEFFGARAGLGHMVFIASQNFSTAEVWLGVFILALIGMTLIRLMYRLERWLAPWRDFKMP